MKEYVDKVIELVVLYGPKLVGAIIVLVIGLIIIKLVMKGIKKIFEKRKFDVSLQSFLVSMINISLQVLLWVSVLGMVGIEMTSFIAILGAASLAIGMALTGTLQNFASGVMILIFKPYKVGDTINAQGVTGTVSEIQIFNTILKTPDNKTIIIPNSQFSNTIMTNYTTENTRTIEWTFGVAYGTKVEKVQEVIKNILSADNRILKETEPTIVLGALSEHSVNFIVRVMVGSSDYWNVYFDTNKKVYENFSNAGIGIPFPQMDVHLHQK